MNILKRLFLALQWLAFFPFFFSFFFFAFFFILVFAFLFFENGLFGIDYYGPSEYLIYLAILLVPYPIIIFIRWLLFGKWYFLPWKKDSIKVFK